MMPYYVGIDGGGTKTAVELRTRGSAAHSRAVFGPLNCNSDRPAAAKALADTLAWLAAQPEGLAGCDGLCIGSAGISNPDAYNFIQDIIRAGGYTGPLQIVGDQVTALAGALGQPVGTVLIAGTGSICYARTADGREARSGGWGHLIDDCGSGYALGRAALALAVQTSDGRADAQTLLQAMYQATGSQDVQGILNYVYYSGQDKSAIAALAKAVLACAQADDEASLAILRQGAAELARIAQALSKRLDMPRPRLALLGGLLTHESPYRVLAFEALQPYAQIVSAQHDALWGAAQLAYEKSRETK